MYVSWRFRLSSPGRGLPSWSLRFLTASLSVCVLAPVGSRGAVAQQPAIQARSRAVLTVDGRRFRDANGSGRVDRYEDWRLPVDVRVDDLVSRMTLEEKAGLMPIDTMGPGCGGALTAHERHARFGPAASPARKGRQRERRPSPGRCEDRMLCHG